MSTVNENMPSKKQFIAVKLLYLIVLCVVLSACNKNPDNLLFQQLNKEIIAPGYLQLKNQTGNIELDRSQCVTGQSEQALAEMRDYWRVTMDAWQTVQWIKFGPITTHSREWRIQFWPDPKNIIGRKINVILKASNMSTESLEKVGIVAQGLPSLEYVLFDAKVAQISTVEQQCLLGLLLVKELSLLTQSIYHDWLAFSTQQRQELNSAEDEAKKKRVTVLVVNSLIQQLDVMIDQKIAKPFSLGEKQSRINPYFLESWRSQNSYRNIKKNVVAIKRVFNQGGLKNYLLSAKQVDLAEDIQDMMSSVEAVMQNTEPFRFSDVVDDAYSEKVEIESLYLQLNELRRLIKTDLTKALNIRLNFNASDGDS